MLVTSLMRNHEDNPGCSQSHSLEFAILRSRRAGVVCFISLYHEVHQSRVLSGRFAEAYAAR